jgi:hypothetical protein
MPSERQFRPGQFILSTIAPTLNASARQDARVVLGIDECVNAPQWIAPLVTRLMEHGHVSEATPLWYSTRPFADEQPEGAPQFINKPGVFDRASAAARREAFKQLGIPQTGRHRSGQDEWPDEGVVSLMVCAFLRSERVCLLTGNVARGVDGLYRILHDEVAPALESIQPRRLGLTALVRRPGSTLAEYAQAVEAWFRGHNVQPGFLWAVL